jgi:LytS/YehU family sensor histidine kinase
VELYLALEQLRFGDKFTYTISVTLETPADKLFVPVLIIQPYVENSIWHGIMNLAEEKKGHINVLVSLEKEILIIKIEDNGVGREVAAEFSRKDHDSKSTWINKKRTEIINMEGSGMENVLLEDIKNEDGTVGGTRATIRIRQTKLVNHE